MWLRPWTLRVFRAAAEASFPAGAGGAPDWRAARVDARFEAWLLDLPALQRALMVLLFLVVELGTPFLAPGLSRFSRRSPAARVQALERLRGSALYPLRLLGDSVKAVTSMMYFSDPGVLAHLGMFSVCERPDDPLTIDVRPEALRERAARAAARSREEARA